MANSDLEPSYDLPGGETPPFDLLLPLPLLLLLLLILLIPLVPIGGFATDAT